MAYTRRQFYDLVEIFRIGGFAPYTNYLFLGTTALRSTARGHRSADACAGSQVTTWIEGFSASRPSPSSPASSFGIPTECSLSEGTTSLGQ